MTRTSTPPVRFAPTGGRQETRKKLLREKPFCVWCGEDFTKPATQHWQAFPGNYPTIEHLKPLCDGGTDDYANLALACFRCNTSRQGGRPPHLIVRDLVMRAIGK